MKYSWSVNTCISRHCQRSDNKCTRHVRSKTCTRDVRSTWSVISLPSLIIIFRKSCYHILVLMKLYIIKLCLELLKFPIMEELIEANDKKKYSILTCVKLKVYQIQWVLNNGWFITVLKVTFLPCSKQKLFFTHPNVWFLINFSL